MPKIWRTASPHPEQHSNESRTFFKNPWPSAGAPTWAELRQQSFPLGWYGETGGRDKTLGALKVVKPDWGELTMKQRQLGRDSCLIGTWLGHASVMVEVPLLVDAVLPKAESEKAQPKRSAWLLFDPMFSGRAGPTQYTGPSRWNPPPCQIDDLPGCDVVFISHNHYDHLDLGSIKAVLKHFPRARYFVPLGLKRWLIDSGVPEDLVCELDWWQGSDFGFEDVSIGAVPDQSTETISLQVSCVPAQHNSGRTATDQASTLWCGWVIERFKRSKPASSTQEATKTRHGSIYHAGDTGYRRTAKSETICPVFMEIGQRFGPFDLSFIPIWRGGTLGFISSWGLRLSHDDVPAALHCSPADAVNIHIDVQSLNTIGIHFGTFVGSENETYEALTEFRKACREKAVQGLDQKSTTGGNGRAGTLNIGESFAIELG